MRSMTRSQDKPVNSEKPTAKSAISSSVAPLKPRSCAAPRPMTSPNTPPGARGSSAGIRHKRVASMAALARSTSAKPSATKMNGCSRSRAGSTICRYDVTMATMPATTHHQADRPKR